MRKRDTDSHSHLEDVSELSFTAFSSLIGTSLNGLVELGTKLSQVRFDLMASSNIISQQMGSYFTKHPFPDRGGSKL